MSKKSVEAVEQMNLPEVTELSVERKKEYQRVCKQLASCVKSLELNYIRMALGLAQIDSHQLYEVEGYKNIYEFAKDRYAISKSTCYNFLGLVSVFGLTADSKPLYTSQQMVALLPYARKGGNVEEFSPDMSVREIKKLVKERLSTRLENDEVEQGVIDVECADVTDEIENVLITCNGKEDYDSKIDAIDTLILNAFAKSKKKVKIKVVMVEYE